MYRRSGVIPARSAEHDMEEVTPRPGPEPPPDAAPPLPVLSEFVLDEMRERERRNAVKRFFLRPVIAPVMPPVSDPQNPWRMLAETIPVNAAVARPVHPVRPERGTAGAARSRFRKGVMLMDPDGFTLRGTGVVPVLWLSRVGCFGYCLCALLIVSGRWTNLSDDLFYWIGGIAFCAGLLGYALESAVTESRRAPYEIRVAWTDMLEAQFETEMRWAVVVYREPVEKLGATAAVVHLPISDLTPAIAGALWDAFESYALGRARPDGGGYRWTTERKIAAALIFGTIISGILLLVRNAIKP